MLLALECSTDRRSVALARDRVVLAESSHQGGRETPLSALVTTTLAQAGVKPADVDAIAVGLGPGSYTGIRAAIAFVQGWELARSVRLLGIDSASAIARRAWRLGMPGEQTVVIDAQRGEGYLARYLLAPAGVTTLLPLRLATVAELQALRADGTRLIGPDLPHLGLPGTPVWPDAAAIAELAAERTDFVSAETLEPVYLRPTAFVKAPPPRRSA